jgi:hypothetical protein
LATKVNEEHRRLRGNKLFLFDLFALLFSDILNVVLYVFNERSKDSFHVEEAESGEPSSQNIEEGRKEKEDIMHTQEIKRINKIIDYRDNMFKYYEDIKLQDVSINKRRNSYS